MGGSETIVLWGRDDGLGGGIQRLLPEHKRRKLFWIEATDNIDVLFETIRRETPNVVIIYDDELFDNAQLPILIINQLPTVKVIEVSLNTNLINVYSKYQVNIDTVTDLLAAVQD